MKRGPSIAKILDTRNLKAVKLKFDVRAEHKWEPPVAKCSLCGCRGAHYCTGGQPQGGAYTSKRTDDLPVFSDWMD